jgi:phage baseplate assembly protein gpV
MKYLKIFAIIIFMALSIWLIAWVILPKKSDNLSSTKEQSSANFSSSNPFKTTISSSGVVSELFQELYSSSTVSLYPFTNFSSSKITSTSLNTVNKPEIKESIKASGSQIEVKENTIVTGDISSDNETIIIRKNCVINGNITTTGGEIIVEDGVTVNGIITSTSGSIAIGSSGGFGSIIFLSGSLKIGSSNLFNGDVYSFSTTPKFEKGGDNVFKGKMP